MVRDGLGHGLRAGVSPSHLHEAVFQPNDIVVFRVLFRTTCITHITYCRRFLYLSKMEYHISDQNSIRHNLSRYTTRYYKLNILSSSYDSRQKPDHFRIGGDIWSI